ncbi:MAG TPA: polysaccharide biosynthesis tyrosine autokinase, partial [Chryseolinea sp.]|nr:polysaccharide biosynthesis tyrosine autokinase [Chryseolinea sp.]
MAGKKSVRLIVGRLLSRWYYFLIALCLTLPLAYAYLRITPKQYVVKASLLLMNEVPQGAESESNSKSQKEPAPDGNVVDEIGILKSYSMIEQAVRDLGFGITYFVKKDFLTTEKFEDAPLKVEIDSMVNQVIDIPVYIKRISSTRYHVRAKGKSVKVYNFFTNQIETTLEHFEINEEVPLDKPFVNKYLSFKLKFTQHLRGADDGEMLFVVERIQSVTEAYQRNMVIDKLAIDSKIVDISIIGESPAKEKLFLTKLLDVYLKSELQKKNQLALKTIQFIDNQLANSGDTINVQMRNYLEEKRVEARIALASNSVEKTFVDKPYTANGGEPVFPDEKTIYMFAAIAGFGFAMIVMMLKDFLNDNIISSEDVEHNTKIPFIGTISHANKREQSSIVAHARSPVGESFRSLRVNLQYLTLGANANVIGITSSRESEGKTFCSVNLAAVMAYSGRRTILIDTDMRRPRVASYFQLENRKGLSNFLVGDGSTKEIINNTEHKGFDVIGSGPIPPNPVDLIGSPRMEELINTLKQTYSTIILDSPPLGYVSEYIILMKYTDANLYIVRSDYTNRNSLKKINKLFEREKITNFSILLNDVKPSKASGS